jgi:uridine phosphorylase
LEGAGRKKKKQMIQSSELILNPDGSVYHLNLKPGTLHTTSSLGDQNRVEKITQFFDSIEFSTQKRIQNQTECSKAKESQ